MRIISWFYDLYEIIAYIICPPVCFSCRSVMVVRAILCERCENSLDLIAPKMFSLGERYILTVYTVSRYTEPLRPMLFAKYWQNPGVIEKIADIIWEKSVISCVQVDCLIPIPLHWSRILKRGFNQADIIAQRLSNHSKNSTTSKSGFIPVVHALKRVKRTEYQVRVEHVDRRCNVKKAFALTEFDFDLCGKHVMLVDDSCTTGSTAIEAAKMLIKFKPASINMIVACRAL